MKKHKISCILSLAAAFALTACSDKTGVHILDSPGAEPEYLSFFSNTSLSGSDVTKYWIDLFSETYNKQVYIDFDVAGYYEAEGLSYRELLEKRMESSAPDDLYIINAEDVLEFEKKGYWMDLSEMDFVDNLSEAALYQSTYNGKVFSIPLAFTGFGFVWNMDILEKYNLSIPQNREEFLSVCGELKSNGILPYGANKGYALTVPAMCAGLSGLYGSDDITDKIADLNSGEALLSDYMREGYEFLAMMIEKGYMDPQQAMETTPEIEDMELFYAGECAFICTTLSVLHEMPKEAVDVEMTGIPVLEEGSVTVFGADRRLCVNPNSKHLDTVLQFIEMIGTSEALAKSAELEEAVSSAKNTKTIEFPRAQELASLLQQPGQIPNQDFSLHFNTWENIRDISREICGGMSVEEACSMLDERQKQELAEYGGQ